jgi:hypothetical protein
MAALQLTSIVILIFKRKTGALAPFSYFQVFPVCLEIHAKILIDGTTTVGIVTVIITTLSIQDSRHK